MQEEYNWKNKNIIVADDDALNTELIKLMLRRTSANIVLFKDGKEVSDYVLDKGTLVDIVLIDIQMPIMNGIDATKIIRDAGLDIPIIALTALNNIKSDKSYDELLFDEVLEKPINRVKLLKHIDDIFHQ